MPRVQYLKRQSLLRKQLVILMKLKKDTKVLGDFINAVSTSVGLLVMSVSLVFYVNYRLYLNITKKYG